MNSRYSFFLVGRPLNLLVADAFPAARLKVKGLQQLLLLQLPANSFVKDEDSRVTMVLRLCREFFFRFERKSLDNYFLFLRLFFVFQGPLFNLERATQGFLTEILQVRVLGQLPQRARYSHLKQVPDSGLCLALVEDDIMEEQGQGFARSGLKYSDQRVLVGFVS